MQSPLVTNWTLTGPFHRHLREIDCSLAVALPYKTYWTQDDTQTNKLLKLNKNMLNKWRSTCEDSISVLKLSHELRTQFRCTLFLLLILRFVEDRACFGHSTGHNLIDRQKIRGLVVMGGDSCSKGHLFESLHRILDGQLFHIYLF